MEEGIEPDTQGLVASAGVTSTTYINATAFNDTADLNIFAFYESVQYPVLWILFVAIVVGNSSVIAVMLFTKTRKSRMNYFILHLAIADLSVGMIYLLGDIMQKIIIDWTSVALVCKVVKFTQGICLYASTYVLVALSIDRCDAITNPMNFTGSWLRAKILVATAWLLSILFSTPVLLLYNIEEKQGHLQCWIELGSKLNWRIWFIVVSLEIFFLPALIITACYTVIILTIWIKSKTVVMTPTYVNKKTKNGGTNNCDDAEHEMESRRASSRGLIPRAKIKSVKMTFVIVFVFILCWSPYMVFDLLQVYDFFPNSQKLIAWATLIQSLAPLNSAANPLICCLFSPHICDGLSHIPPYSWIFSRLAKRHRSTIRSRSDSTANSELISSSQRRSHRTHVTHTGATVLNSSIPRLNSSSSDRDSKNSHIVIMPTNKSNQ